MANTGLTFDNVKDLLGQMTYEQLDLLNRHSYRLMNQNSAFIQLPAEIRDLIYESVIKDWIHNMGRACDVPAQPPLPPLFSTCQKIRNEGNHVFYNKFMMVTRVDNFTCGGWVLSRRFGADEAVKLSLRRCTSHPVSLKCLTTARGYHSCAFHLHKVKNEKKKFCTLRPNRPRDLVESTYYVCEYPVTPSAEATIRDVLAPPYPFAHPLPHSRYGQVDEATWSFKECRWTHTYANGNKEIGVRQQQRNPFGLTLPPRPASAPGAAAGSRQPPFTDFRYFDNMIVPIDEEDSDRYHSGPEDEPVSDDD